MDFFGIGLGEVLLILILALIIWGPKRLPEIARILGRTVHVLRKATNDFTSQVTREIDLEEIDSKEKGQTAQHRDSGTVKRDTAKDEPR